MVGFAEELGEVGRDRVDEAFQFRVVGSEMLPIFAKRTQSERAQAARQAAVDEIALAFRKRNPGVLVGEFHQRLEISVGEYKFALGFRDGRYAVC